MMKNRHVEPGQATPEERILDAARDLPPEGRKLIREALGAVSKKEKDE